MPNVRLVRSSLTAAGALAMFASCSVYTEDLLLEASEELTDDGGSGSAPSSGTGGDTTDPTPSVTDPDEPDDPGEDMLGTPTAPTPNLPDTSGTPSPTAPPTDTSSSMAPTGTDAPPPSTANPGDSGSPPDPVGTSTDDPVDEPPETDTGETPEPEPEPEPDPNAPSEDALIDDFDSRITRLNGGQREGFWFTDGSSDGDITNIDDVFVELASGGAAAHVVASGFTPPPVDEADPPGGWAVFGVNFNDGGNEPPPAYVQAAQYDGLQFWACTAAASGSSELYVEIPTTDTSSEHDADNENNHFRYRLELSDTWTQVVLDWDDFKQTWGASREFAADHVIGIQFSLLAEEFDLWIDNLEFNPPDGSEPSNPPPTGPCPTSAPAMSIADAG